MKLPIRLLLALSTLVTTLQADVPLKINYQGSVYDSTGNAIGAAAAVNRKVIFRLYSASTGGTLLWNEEQTVTIYKGEFSIVLGNGNTPTGSAANELGTRPALDTVFTSNSTTRFLEVMVDNGDNVINSTDTPISPRQLITTGFYAFHALVADGIASSSDLTINPPTGSGTASNYGLGWYGTGRLWNGLGVDGPVLYGNSGGVLGSNASGTRNTALLWNAAGQVGIGATGAFTTNNKLTLQGDDTATTTTAARQLIIRGNTDSNEAVYLGFDTTNNRATLQSYTSASAGTGGSLLLNPSGGTVGIGTGTTAPVARLTVEGSISATGSGGYTFGTGGDNDGGMFSPADGTLSFRTNGNERLRIDSAGKVGIGETPTNKLSVVGSTGSVSAANAVAKFGGSDTHVYLGAGDSTFGYLPYIQSYNGNGSGVWPLALQPAGGKVGIGGIKDPYTQLHLIGSAGTGAPALRTEGSLYLQDNGGSVGNGGALLFGSVNFNVAGNGGMFAGIKGYAGDASQPQQVGDLVFYTRRTGSDANLTETMRLTQGGRVGIGTTSPRCPLEITGLTSITYTGDDYSTGAGWINKASPSSETQNVSIYSSNWVACLAIQVFSDQRVKSDIHLTDNQSDLQTLMGIEISDYKYKDGRKFGAKPQKKVIAQQVEKVYPQAVAASTDVVPDIFKKATAKAGWVNLATDLKVGERVKLINETEQSVHEVLEVRDGAFRTDYQVDTEKLFVYGREVKDFRTVDYDAIAMLNVSATQQIKKEKDLELKALKEQLAAAHKVASAQEARIAALEAGERTRQARNEAQQAEQSAKLAALERLLNRQLLSTRPAAVLNASVKTAE